jgi:8-oxo-dGTP pyrophosphatase MutT (NUDIX family)
MNNNRTILFSVTNFLYIGDEYLLLHRSMDRKVDAGRLNGIGGKLEEGENFLEAAIRETQEETGYEVTAKDIQFSGIIKLHGGYPEDWVMCFFKIKVPKKTIPLGSHIPDGDLIWMPKDKVLTSGYELVDDLYHVWESIITDKTFFATTEIGEDEKVKKISISTIPF